MSERPILLRATDVRKHFPQSGGLLRRAKPPVRAVDGVSLEVRAGETLGLVGESGCGKSTLARCLLRLTDITAGTIAFEGRDITRLSRHQLRPLRREAQMVFQDPAASLNPRQRVGQIVGAPLQIHGASARETRTRVAALLERVGLDRAHASRYPHEFSGGQRQRIGIARALALGPKLIVADEPVSALDVSVQAQVVNLLADLQDQLGIAYVFVAHDLSVVRQVSDRIAVMYLGRIVETGPAEDVIARPQHPYTEALLSAVPVPDPEPDPRRRRRIVLEGDLPSPAAPPAGCRFHPRCSYATDRCRTEEPRLGSATDSAAAEAVHQLACHHPLRGETRAVAVPN